MQNSNQEIGIIALDSHFEIVSNILDILSGSQLTIHVLVSNPPDNLLSRGDQIKIVRSSLHRHQSILHFLGNLKNSTKILVVTIYKDYRFYYNLSKSYSLSFIVHNIHYTFADNRYKKRQGVIHLDHLKLLIRDILFRDSHYKKKLLDSSSNLHFLSLSTLNYAKANYSNWKSKFKVLPYIFTLDKIPQKSSCYTIVIPGGVNAANREHDYLKKWLSQVSGTTPIRVVFLGKSSSRQCQNLISDLIDTYQNQVEIISFKQYVDQPIYDHWISQADLLLSP
ncbi:MAG: hypothetical protein IPL46_08285 [Saprospiraceae bacterium]|nr:hypothetical protein [Saprospiraceae bacterium]